MSAVSRDIMGSSNRNPFLAFVKWLGIPGLVCTLALFVLVFKTVDPVLSVVEDMLSLSLSLSFPQGPSAGAERLSAEQFTWPLRTLDGKEVRLSKFKGKVLFVNLWATWCGSCIAEMPSLQRLYDSLKNEPVVFLMISNENAKTVRRFVNSERFTAPVYLTDGRIPSVFQSGFIPATFILDGDGRVRFKHIGMARWDDESTVRFLRSLMDSQPPMDREPPSSRMLL